MLPRRSHVLRAILATVLAVGAAPSPIKAASGGACVADSDHSFPTGFSTGTSFSYEGVRARMAVSSASGAFENCGDLVGDPSASSLWVAISGSDVITYHPPIIQVGIVRCDSGPIYGWCQGENPHYVLSYQGCLPAGATNIDLGTADFSYHDYAVIHSLVDDNWYIYIDSSVVRTVNGADPQISCWDNAAKHRAQWFGERWNRGDSLGSPTYVALIWNAQYWHETLGWLTPSGSACTTAPLTGIGRSYCSRTDGSASFYTIY